jgi:stage V sporulation protein SpoVS
MLSRKEILDADDFEYEIISVPEWGGDVRVRGLSAGERDEWEMAAVQAQGNASKLQNVRATIISKSIVDEVGKRIFTDADISKLGKKSAKAMDRVFDVCSRLNGMSAADLKEIEGN